MKTRITFGITIALILFTYSCSTGKYVHHTVRMVDAKSYMDHPPTAGIYYYK